MTSKEYPILWWTRWFGEDRYEGMVTDQCGLPYTCKHTLDRSRYADSRVVVFHDWDPHDLPPVKDAQNNVKAWVLNKAERPDPHHYQARYMNLFTYRFTYHFGSDFIGSYFKAGRDLPDGLINLVSRPAFKSLAQKNQYRQHGFHPQDNRPLAPVAWIASNCEATNGRHFMVQQLQKYIPVDIYGHCIPSRAWPKQASTSNNNNNINININTPDSEDDSAKEMSDEELVSHYKFYLALENTNCEDYITEKLWRPLAVGSVPIVDGPKDYSRLQPAAKSLIVYDDFGSPQALAAFLRRLDQDDGAYEEYLSYRAKKNAANTDSNGHVRISEPETFNQDYKDRLLPWFVDNWDLDTTGSLNKTTTEWLTHGTGPNRGKVRASDVPSREKYGMQWGPDYHGGMCALCREVHDLTEGIKKLPLTLPPTDGSHTTGMKIKRLGVDKTCRFHKFYYPTWIVAFYPYASLILFVLLTALVWLITTRMGRLVARHGVHRVWAMSTRALVAMRIMKSTGHDHQYFELSV
ncbi:hypothetical protein EMPS_07265 [Entomortierella parvispora]|uniref:Fucosyltransferase n=1 Tax=Entomortierella parvispora TaxID=205924 RepID=A0A9P3HE08_9FUNG|nr:hypothetical protein EMPS_07265 [Entomortierella parvispora]